MKKIISLISVIAIFGCKKNTVRRDEGPVFVSTDVSSQQAQSATGAEAPFWCARLDMGFKWERGICFQERNTITIRETPSATPNLDKRFKVLAWEVALVDSKQLVSKKVWMVKASVQNVASQPLNCRFGLIAQVDSLAPAARRCSIATPGMGAKTFVAPGHVTEISDTNEACDYNQTFWGPESRASVVVMCGSESQVFFVPYSINWP